MVYGVLSQPYTTNHTVYIVFQAACGTFDLYGCHGTKLTETSVASV